MKHHGLRGAIISAENLCNPRKELLFSCARDFFRVHVIYYIRAQGDWISSAWKQWGLKEGHSLSDYFEQCLEKNMPGYQGTIDRWEPLVDEISVRSINHLGSGGVYLDFAQTLGLENLHVPDSHVNSSYDYSLLETLRHNSYLFRTRHDNKLYKSLDRLVEQRDIFSPTTTLSVEFRNEVESFFLNENEILAERCGVGQLKAFSSATSYPPALTTDIEILYRALGQMINMIAKLQSEVDQLSKGMSKRSR